MIQADDHEANETIRWILDNADMGFFIVTASPTKQREIANLYKTSRVVIYDYMDEERPYSYYRLSAWAESNTEAEVFFVLNMQLVLQNENDMTSFNMSRDMLANEHKIWFFFMNRDTDNRLSKFAYDIYSYVRQKARFLEEGSIETRLPELVSDDELYDRRKIKDALARYKELEEQYMALSLDDTPKNQLLSAAVSLSNISRLCKNNAEYDNALKLLERIKEIRERVLGTEHQDTASTYNNIAYIHEKQANYIVALEWYLKSYMTILIKLGESHPNTVKIKKNMEATYAEAGFQQPFEDWLVNSMK